MSKDGIKKLGNPTLDAKQVAIDIWEAETSDDKKLLSEYKASLKFMKLLELMKHFKINPRDKNAWMYLSMELADHSVPAMQFAEKLGQPKKWNLDNKIRLYALVETLRSRFPKMKRKEIFNQLPKAAQQTSLASVITDLTKPITLEGHYDKFIASKEGKEVISIFSKYTLEERVEVFSEILANDDYFISK